MCLIPDCVLFHMLDRRMCTIARLTTLVDSGGDSFKLGDTSLPQVDVYAAGFPCRGYSCMNRKVDLGQDENRKYLEQHRIIRTSR